MEFQKLNEIDTSKIPSTSIPIVHYYSEIKKYTTPIPNISTPAPVRSETIPWFVYKVFFLSIRGWSPSGYDEAGSSKQAVRRDRSRYKDESRAVSLQQRKRTIHTSISYGAAEE